MGLNKNFLFGFLLASTFFGCSALFSYKWYGLELVSYKEGILRGPKPDQDVSLEKCQPDTTDKGKCIVMFDDEFRVMKGEFETTKDALIQCQKELSHCH